MKTNVSNFQITATSAVLKNGNNGYLVEVKGLEGKVNASQQFQEPLKAMRYMFVLSKRLKLNINRLDLAAVSLDYQRAKAKAEEAAKEQADIVADATQTISEVPTEDPQELPLQLSFDGEATPIMKQWTDLKAKHPEALLLFRCGEFYEMYEDDAAVAAPILGITLTKRQKDNSRMAGFPYHSLDTYLPKLIRAGKRVAICDQLEEKKPSKKVVSINEKVKAE